METFTFTKEGVTIETIKTSKGHRYRWVKSDGPSQEKKNYIPIFIMDFSWSMKNSNSDHDAYRALIDCCHAQFDSGVTEIYVIMFGADACCRKVYNNNYVQVIDTMLGNYLSVTSCEYIGVTSLFRTQNTCPEYAFNELNAITTLPDVHYPIIFMTDGQFHISSVGVWSQIAKQLAGRSIQIYAVGYQNDYLKNIRDMKTGFDTTNTPFSYKTINYSSEISNAMKECCDSIMVNHVPSVKLADGKILQEYSCMFSDDIYYDGIETTPVDLIRVNTENNGIERLWVEEVCNEIIALGMYIAKNVEMLESIKIQTQSKYKELFTDMTRMHSTLHKRYLELRMRYKSIKSRKVPIWSEYVECINEFIALYNSVQSLCGSQLTDKKQFEISTNIRSSISEKHYRNLQRRRTINDEKHQQTRKVTMISEDPVILQMESDKYIDKVTMHSSKKDLDDVFTCFFSQENFSDLVESMIGLPIKYVWKSNDDWNSARAFIEHVCTAGFLSEDALTDVQELFATSDTSSHEELYKLSGYIKAAHDANNAYLPIATHPFFPVNKADFEGRLAHMLIGTNLGFASRHINFYIAVIKQTVNQYLEKPTERTHHLIMLLLNTYRILFHKYRTIYQLNQTPMDYHSILVQIASGNTAPCYFDSSWSTAVIVLISEADNVERARIEFDPELSTEQFRQLLWRQVFRHMMLVYFGYKDSNLDDWMKPTTWNLPSNTEIRELLKSSTFSDNQSFIDAVNSHAMNLDHLKTKPSLIDAKIDQLMDSKIVRLFTTLLKIDDTIRTVPTFWNDFTLEPTKTVFTTTETMSNYFRTDNQVFRNILFTSFWEATIYGDKDCYPMKSIETLNQHIVNRINANYGQDVKTLIDDANEYMEFQKKHYELRFSPVIFTSQMIESINALFTDINSGSIELDEFRSQLRTILGEYACVGFDDALTIDKIDIVKNLFEYCKTHHNILTLKDNGLPYSAPAHPTSPIFLQTLSDIQFSKYYKAVGFGWAGKKYRSWIDTLHPYMMNIKHLPIDEFTTQTMELIKQHNCDEDLTSYIRYAYGIYNQSDQKNSQCTTEFNIKKD